MDNDAFAVLMTQMQAQMQQMQADHASQMQAAHSQLQAASVSHAHAPRSASLRIAPPPMYNGATPPLDEWTAAIRQQFAFYTIASDAEQIRFAAAHLRGPALDWYEQACLVSEPTTWQHVDAGLRTRFQPVTTADTARAKLFALEQGKSSVNDYVASFRRLVVALKTTDADTLMFQFRRGLHHSLRMHLLQAQPTTLDAAIALAVRMGSAYVASAAPSSSGAAMDLNAVDAHGDAESDADAPVTRAEFATLLAAIHAGGVGRSGGNGGARASSASAGASGGPRLPRMAGFTDEKIRRYMDAGMCFGCDSKEHRARECPRRKIDAATGRLSWSK